MQCLQCFSNNGPSKWKYFHKIPFYAKNWKAQILRQKFSLAGFKSSFLWNRQLQSSVQAQGQCRRDVAACPLLAPSLRFPQSFCWVGDTSASTQAPWKIFQENSRITDVVACFVSALFLLKCFPFLPLPQYKSICYLQKHLFLSWAFTASLGLNLGPL